MNLNESVINFVRGSLEFAQFIRFGTFNDEHSDT